MFFLLFLGDTMEEEISLQLKEINEKLSPMLGDALEGIDYKTVIIYFSGLLKNFLEDLDDPDFKKLIFTYLFDGDNDVKI